MIRRSGDQPRARCVPGLYTHSSLPSGRSHLSRTTLLRAHLGVEKVWKMAVHSITPVGQERGGSGWSICRRAGRREKKDVKGWIRHPNPRRPLDRAMWRGCGKVPGARDSLQDQVMDTCASPEREYGA